MTNKKNTVTIVIEDCQRCPNATLKLNGIMYCQTPGELIMLRNNWGSCVIPDWCPRLRRQSSLDGKYIENFNTMN
jgi:hypothetical protein